MKIKIFLVSLLCLFGFSTLGFAAENPTTSLAAQFKVFQKKILKVEANIKNLNAKLKKVKGKKAKTQKAKITKMIKAEKKRLDGLEKAMEIAYEKAMKAEPTSESGVQSINVQTGEAMPSIAPATVESVVIKHASKGFISYGLGFAGGAGVGKVGYVYPISDDSNIRPEIGLGVGAEYQLLMARVIVDKMIRENIYVGVSLDVANYSSIVKGIIGLPEYIEKGIRPGAGVLCGFKLNQIDLQAGYSLALGAYGFASYAF